MILWSTGQESLEKETASVTVNQDNLEVQNDRAALVSKVSCGCHGIFWILRKTYFAPGFEKIVWMSRNYTGSPTIKHSDKLLCIK